MTDSLKVAVEISRPGAVHYVCINHQHLDELLQAASEVYARRLNLCVWNKSNAGMGGLYRNKHELIGVFVAGAGTPLNTVELGKHGRNRTNVWDYPSVNTFGGSRRHDLALHPTVKPIRMVADAIKDVSRPGDVVLDSFLGSGTTLLAAERVGRRFIGMDCDPRYVDLALKRYWDMTGVEPVHCITGLTFSELAKERASARAADAG